MSPIRQRNDVNLVAVENKFGVTNVELFTGSVAQTADECRCLRETPTIFASGSSGLSSGEGG
jgi:hypothetical protein